MLLVMAPWADPVPMKRAWCLWEMLCALQLKDRVVLHVRLSPGEKKPFRAKLAEEVMNMLVRVDAKKAQAYLPHDREMIFESIKETIGFNALNEQVKTFLRLWCLETAEEAVDLAFDGQSLVADNIGEDEHDDLLDLGRLAGSVASMLDDYGRHDKALEYHAKALAIKRAVLGDDHPDTAGTYHNMAVVCKNQGQYDKALGYYEKALAIRRAVFGDDHPHTASTYNNMASVYDNQGQYDKALEYYEKALAIRRAVLGDDHPDTAMTYNDMANVYLDQGQYDKALEYYGKALAISRAVLGDDHPSTASTYNNMAAVKDRQGKSEELLAIERAVDDHPHTAGTDNTRANVSKQQGSCCELL